MPFTVLSFAKLKASYANGRDAGIHSTVGPLGFGSNHLVMESIIIPLMGTRYAFTSDYNYSTGTLIIMR